MTCPLCLDQATRAFCADGRRRYRHCFSCGLVFVPPSWHVSVDEERKRYDLHDNTGDHDGYRAFLCTVAAAAMRELLSGGRILDFGCGKNAVLTALLNDRGVDCTPYDPLYGIGAGALSQRYDVIVVCEVVEHLREPRDELLRIGRALSPGGSVVVRTRWYPSLDAFGSWWYKDDSTHINFFSRKTIETVAAIIDCKEIVFEKDDLAVLRRKSRRKTLQAHQDFPDAFPQLDVRFP